MEKINKMPFELEDFYKAVLIRHYKIGRTYWAHNTFRIRTKYPARLKSNDKIVWLSGYTFVLG